MRHIVAFVFSLGLASGAAPREVRAQEQAMSEQAVSKGHEGLQLLSEGKFALARAAFAEADSLAHSPVFVLYLGRAQRGLGQFLEARESFRRCARESIGKDSPLAWKKAVAEAVSELGELESQIPRVRLRVVGEATFPVSVQSAGRSLSLSEPEALWQLDPGGHEVVVRDSAGTTLRLHLFLRPGERDRDLLLEFPRTSSVDAPRVITSAKAPSSPETLLPKRPYRSGAHAAFFLGGAAYLFTAAATVAAVSKAQRVKKHCVGTRCRPEDQQVAQDAVRWANLATAGFVVGTTSAAFGAGLLLYPSGDGVHVGYRGAF